MRKSRRRFLRYTSLGAASLALSSCERSRSFLPRLSSPKANFGKLEKTDLVIGFVPVIASAPLIIAQEQGLFERYGLSVTLSKQANWSGVQKGLLEYRFDAAQSLAAMPILAQLASTPAPMMSLMVLNLNGGAITLDRKAWQANLRPSPEYINFLEFSDAYRKYLRGLEQPLSYAIASPVSMDALTTRYWLAAIGIKPDTEVNITELPPSQAIHKIGAGSINGYSVGDPWNQQAVFNQAGFTAYVNRDIWQGHPGNVLAAMQPWVDQQPTTARALVAAVLEACQSCDRPENHRSIAQILSQRQYLDVDPSFIEPSLTGKYSYTRLDEQPSAFIQDLNIFHFRDTDYLEKPNHANYPWRSHGVWLLTQLIRWNLVEPRAYPAQADRLLKQIYPLDVYQDVAQALEIKLPKEPMKIESETVFIDRREFDPSEPVAYLNQFERA